MAKIYATTDPKISRREIINMNFSRSLAAQGMVLLKNGGSLPLSDKVKTIAAFGNGIRKTVKGGTGSGDVNSRLVINLEQGLKEAGYILAGQDWCNRLDALDEKEKTAYYEEAKKEVEKDFISGIMAIAENPYHAANSVAVTEEDLVPADACIYCISRNSGEGKDRKLLPGDYYLTDEEKDNLNRLIAYYGKVIVLLNIGGPMDSAFLRNTPGIDALLLTSQAGNITGYAITDVITGKVTPSGHLTTTWAEKYEDILGAADFSYRNGDTDDEYYKEDIYVGYRYFDTFGVTPAFPFGYGLSYTDFDVAPEDVTIEGTRVTVTATVTNSGADYSGREVLQVYYSAPEGRLEKPYQELCAFAKTGELSPGESQTLTMTFDVTQMASYDTKRAAYVFEPGTYYVRMGNHSRNTCVVAAMELAEEVIAEQLTNVLALDCRMETLSKKGALPYGYPEEAAEMAAAKVLTIDPAAITLQKPVYKKDFPKIQGRITDHTVTMDEVREGNASLDDLVAQLTVPEMADLCCGVARGGFGEGSFIGMASIACPGAAGDTSSALLESRGIKNMTLVDGPAGLRLSVHFTLGPDGSIVPGTEGAPMPGLELMIPPVPPVIPEGAVTYYQYATAIPIATLLAMSWDEAVIEAAGDMVGGEMKELGCTIWLAPGMNIHRNPLCGRNFEYYSEDPLVAGKCAAAETRGVQKHSGIGTCIKHFAFNNQEENRDFVNAHVTERAAREIYLKGFEIAVKESQPLSMMTSYNLVNGCHTANRFDTITTCARQEWGFKGLVMTDWGTTGGSAELQKQVHKYPTSNAAGCIAAGNDLIMPGSKKDVDDIIAAVGAGEGQVRYPLTLGQLQNCAKNILRIVKNCAAYEEG